MDDNATPSRNNLNFFYTLDAILNAPTLTEAARKSSLTQPAISMALKKARLHFGDEIVTYVAGRRRLTPLALALRPRVRKALRDAQQILDFSLEFDPACDARTIRATMPDFVEVLFLPHILRAVRAIAPHVDLRIVPFEYWPAARQFEKDIDVVLLPAPLVDREYGAMDLYGEQLSVMMARSHPLIKSRALDRDLCINIEQYVGGSHAALSDTVDMLSPTQGPVADMLAVRNIVVRTATYAALPRMIVDTDLIVTTSAWYAQYCASIMDLVALPLPIETEPDPIQIVLQWQPFRDNDPVLMWFRQILQSVTSFI